MYDLFGVEDLEKSAARARRLALDYLCFHKSTDGAGVGGFVESFQTFSRIAGLPMAVAGKINDETSGELMRELALAEAVLRQNE